MIAVVGLSHRTAPIEVREQLALSAEDIPGLLAELVERRGVGEALVVSTCNRVEVVAAAGAAGGTPAEIAARVRETIVARAPGVAGHLYAHQGSAAVRHLFRVAASLDSLVVGEPQILGQLKAGYDLAREVGTAGAVLHRVLPRAIRSAKRVRSETAIGAGQVSVPSVAVDLAVQIFGDLAGRTVALVGSGEMGESVALLLRGAGASLVAVGRNASRVQELAARLGGEARGLSELERTLVDADVVISATSAPGFVVDLPLVQRSRRSRRGRSLFLIDLAVPRDVDPRVADLDEVFLYNVDDLSHVVAESMEGRRREAERAETIVLDETASYERWAEAEQATPAIVAMRERFRAVLEAEVARSLAGRLRHLGEPERDALRLLVEAALNKMLHPMTTNLRRLAVEPGSRADLPEITALLTELFELAPASAAGLSAEADASATSPVEGAALAGAASAEGPSRGGA